MDLISVSSLIFPLRYVIVKVGKVNDAVDGVSDLDESTRPLLFLPPVVRPNFSYCWASSLGEATSNPAILDPPLNPPRPPK